MGWFIQNRDQDHNLVLFAFAAHTQSRSPRRPRSAQSSRTATAQTAAATALRRARAVAARRARAVAARRARSGKRAAAPTRAPALVLFAFAAHAASVASASSVGTIFSDSHHSNSGCHGAAPRACSSRPSRPQRQASSRAHSSPRPPVWHHGPRPFWKRMPWKPKRESSRHVALPLAELHSRRGAALVSRRPRRAARETLLREEAVGHALGRAKGVRARSLHELQEGVVRQLVRRTHHEGLGEGRGASVVGGVAHERPHVPRVPMPHVGDAIDMAR
eukprot:scaffold3978_cov61-Phaeocystis_antarctica.AAC.7